MKSIPPTIVGITAIHNPSGILNLNLEIALLNLLFFFLFIESYNILKSFISHFNQINGPEVCMIKIIDSLNILEFKLMFEIDVVNKLNANPKNIAVK